MLTLICGLELWFLGAQPPSMAEKNVDVAYAELLLNMRDNEFQTVMHTGVAASLSAQELEKGLLAWQKRIESLDIDLVHTIDGRLQLSVENELRRQGLQVVTDLSVRSRVAIKGHKIFQQEFAPSTDARALLDAPTIVSTTAFNGGVVRRLQSHINSMVVEEAQQGSVSNHIRMYCASALLYDIPSSAEISSAASKEVVATFSFPGIVVLPTLESVDGHPCHVVLARDRAFWVDAEGGFILRRILKLRRVSATDPGCVHTLTVATGFEDCGASMSLPKTVHHCQYTTQNEPEKRRGQLEMVNTFIIVAASINNAPDSLFDLAPPPGALVHNLDTGQSHHVPGGLERLDRSIEQARSVLKNGESSHYTPSKTMRRLDGGWNGRSLIVLAVAGGLIACGILLARWRTASRNSNVS